MTADMWYTIDIMKRPASPHGNEALARLFPSQSLMLVQLRNYYLESLDPKRHTLQAIDLSRSLIIRIRDSATSLVHHGVAHFSEYSRKSHLVLRDVSSLSNRKHISTCAE